MPVILKNFVPLFSVALVVGCFAVAVWSLCFLSGASQRYDANDPAYNKAFWQQEIKNRGGASAYREFLEKNLQEEKNRQHFSAHVMGESLYRVLGIQGISVCDASFAFGCYHGFSSAAISAGGVESVQMLNDICTQTYGILGTGCQHGIGHGVLEYVGYQNIDTALETCGRYARQPAPLLGCSSGVFMEFFTPLAGDAEGLTPTSRMFESQNPYAPCTEVPGAFSDSCYFELGQWFRQTEGVEYGKLCGALTGESEEHCFLGVGTDLTRGWTDSETLISKCSRYSPDGELACRAGAAWSLVGEKAAAAPALCAYSDAALKEKCIELADLTHGLDSSIKQSLQ